MIKFIVPVVIIFLIILYWEKISETIYKKFKIKITYLLLGDRMHEQRMFKVGALSLRLIFYYLIKL